MSDAANSIFMFGIYVEFIGILLCFVPNLILPYIKEATTNEPWIRVIGIFLIVLGFYYIVAAQNELTVFFWASIIGRYTGFLGFVILVLAKKAKPTFILFGLADALGATWTLLVF